MDLSEFELIGKIAGQAPGADRIETGIGDDAAVIRTRGRIVTSVDTAVEGVHFHRDRPAAEVARKAVACAVSDLAAMGLGEGHTEILVALGAPAETPGEYLAGLSEGVVAAAAEFNCALAGGDVVSAPAVFLSVTAISHVDLDTPLVGRDGARPGDIVAVTGPVGGAAAGLALLKGLEVPDMSDLTRELLLACQLQPQPQLSAAPVLAAEGASAMIDVSDGLAADLGHIANASGVRIRLDGDRTPVVAGVPEVAAAIGVDPLLFALSGGEDYVLALTISPEDFPAADDAVIGATGFELVAVGEVVAVGTSDDEQGIGSIVVTRDGQALELGERGHDHFRKPTDQSR